MVKPIFSKLLKFQKFFNILILFSVLSSNVLYPTIALAEELYEPIEENSVVVDTSEDILNEGIQTNIFEEEDIVEENISEYTFKNGIYTVNVVETKEYIYPDNENVRIKFTNVTQEGNLVIKKVSLTEDEKIELNTSDDYAWDISSTMENGSFEYDLTLPNTQGNDIQVKYSEDGGEYQDVNNVFVNEGFVTVKGLDHFTRFVVTTPPALTGTACVAAEASTELGCFSTIQEAIIAASNNDIILVKAGVYDITSTIVVDKSVTISGPTTGIATLEAQNVSSIPVFKITTNNVRIENLQITTTQAAIDSYTSYDGLIQTSQLLSGIEILNNEIWSPLQGARDTMGTWNARGIFIDNGTEAKIDSNTVYNLRTGIFGRYGSTVEITNNTVYNTKGGIMNHTSNLAEDSQKTIVGNSWTAPDPSLSHNEWDIVWNSGGSYSSPFPAEFYEHVVTTSQANNDGYTIDQRGDGIPKAIKGNRSHAFVDENSTFTTEGSNLGNIFEPYATLKLGIEALAPGGTLKLVSDITTTQQINLLNEIVFEGNGHTLFNNFTKTNNSNNSGITIYSDNTVIKDLTINGLGGTNLHGLQMYKASNVTLNNVESLNNDSSGITVNGSTVTATDISTSGNGWGGLNVDQGSGVTTESKLTIKNTSNHDEVKHIWIDDITKPNVSVVDANHQYDFVDIGNQRIYRLDSTPPTATINGVAPESLYNGNFDINVHTIDTNYSKTELYKEGANTPFKTYTGAWFGISWLTEGNYRMVVIDMAGNSTEYTFTIDNTAPTAPTGLQILNNEGTVLGCGGYTNNRNITIDWTDNTETDIANYILDLKDKDDHKQPPISQYKATIRDIDGLYKYKIRAVDLAGNISESSEWCEVTLDRINPTVEIKGIKYPKAEVEDFTTNDNTPILYGTYEDNIGVLTVNIEIEGETKTSTLDNGKWISEEFGTLTEGLHTATVTITDVAGNKTVITQEIFVDTIAPTATFTHFVNGTLFTDPIAYVKGISDLSFQGAYADAGSGLFQDTYVVFQAQNDGTFKFSQNGKLSYCGWRNPANTISLTGNNYTSEEVSFDNCISTLEDGEYYLAHQVFDNAVRKDIPSINQFKDVLGLHFVVDNTKPTGNILTPTDGAELNGIVTVSGHVEDAMSGINKVQARLRSVPGFVIKTDWVMAVVDSNGNYTVDIDTSTLQEGEYEVAVVAYDKAGNNKWLWRRPIIKVDRTAPVVTLTSPIDNYYTSDTVVRQTWGSTDTDVKTYDYRSCSNNPKTDGFCTEIYSKTLTRTYRDVNNNNISFYWQVRGTDNAGNVGEWSEARKMTIDTIAPVVNITSPYDGEVVKGTVELWGYITDTNLSHYNISIYNGGVNVENFSLRLEGNTEYTPEFSNKMLYSWDTTGYLSGNYDIRLAARDLAGNRDLNGPSKQVISIFVDNDTPVVSALSDMVLTEGETFPTNTVSLTDNHELDSMYVEAKDLSGTLGSANGSVVVSTVTMVGNEFPIADEIRKEIEDWRGSPFITIDLAVLPAGEYQITYYATDKVGNESTHQTFKVTVLDNVPTVEILGATTATAGDAPFDLNPNITNGNAPFTYEWSGYCSGTASIYSFSPTTANTYTCRVTVTDADGDIAIANKTITVSPQVIPAVQGITNPNLPTYYYASGSYEELGIGGPEDEVEEENKENDETLEEDVKGTQTCENPKKISGYIYVDNNENSKKDNNERIFKNISLTIYTEDEDGSKTTIKEVTTDEKGYWETTLCNGDYKISINTDDLPNNYSLKNSAVLGISVTDSSDQLEVDILVNDDRTFLQKNWIWILLAITGVTLTGYLVISSKKRE